MSVSGYVLGQEVEIEHCRGSTATAKLYDAAVTEAAMVELTTKRFVTDKGEVIASLGDVFLRPGALVSTGDKITHLGITYVALSAFHVTLGRREHHVEVTLGRLAT